MPKLGLAFAVRHSETLLVLLVLGVALAIGLATAADYGLTIDEFNTEDYGPKALAWYTSGFATGPVRDRRISLVLRSVVSDARRGRAVAGRRRPAHHPARHDLRVGLAGSPRSFRGPADLGCLGRAAALTLCLPTGYPVRQSVLRADRRAVSGRHVLGDSPDRPWREERAELAPDIAPGLDRPGDCDPHRRVITTPTRRRHEPLRARSLLRHGRAGSAAAPSPCRTLVAIAVAWLTAIALWPWLQIGNPLPQFWMPIGTLQSSPTSFEFQNWGGAVHR